MADYMSKQIRWALVALALVFFVPLAVSVGWHPLWVMGHDAWSVRHWVAAPAQLLSCKLAFPHNAKTVVEVQAQYSYQWQQKSYTGQRVSLAVASADGFGSWQRDTYNQLKTAEVAQQNITIWLDPAQPESSVIFRSLRTEMLLFHGLCAGVLSLLAAACVWIAMRPDKRQRRQKR
jgi:Protein of unknown function (DUF3592)